MKNIFKQRMVEQMMDGPSNSGALERIASRLLQPEMLGTIAAAASSIMPTRNQVPAGYDSPTYDPYAQPVQVQPPQQVQQIAQPQPYEMPPPEAQSADNFFEGPEPESQPEPEPEPDIEAEVSPEQYKHALLEQFKTILGTELEDPKTMAAVQEQINITVDNVCVEHSNMAPQRKLDVMAQRMVLTRSLRDIGRGMQDALSKMGEGIEPDLVYSFILTELKKNEVFWSIFSENTYEELMALIEPYKDTGGVIHDYNFLLRSDVAGVCREILQRVQAV
jgi:hypothetical protein